MKPIVVKNSGINVRLEIGKKSYTISKKKFINQGFIEKIGNDYVPVKGKEADINDILPKESKIIVKIKEKEKEPALKEEEEEEEVEEPEDDPEEGTSEPKKPSSKVKDYIQWIDKQQDDYQGDKAFDEWWDEYGDNIEASFHLDPEQLENDIKELNASYITMDPPIDGMSASKQVSKALEDHQPVMRLSFIGSKGDKMLKFRADVYKLSKEGLMRKSDSFEIWKTEEELKKEGFNLASMTSYSRKLLNLHKKTYAHVNIGKTKSRQSQVDYIMKHMDKLS
jgi:hypothetical protein